MENCSYFIKDKALFGSYPVQESINILEKEGVKFFVDLTYNTETKITLYYTKYNYYNFPIEDRSIPNNWYDFSVFITHIINIIKKCDKDNKIYIHCKGGHGRSGVVVACILKIFLNLDVSHSLELTRFYHSQRKNLKERWRKIGSPQTYKQKQFVESFFKELYFYKALKSNYTSGFSNFSLHKIKIKDIGIFHTSEAAYNSYKCEDKNYIQKQINCKTPFNSRKLALEIKETIHWKENKIKIMKKIIHIKLFQHEDFRNNLLNTGYRKIIFSDKNDDFWGLGRNGNGSNNLGKILTELRYELYNNNNISLI